MRRTLTLLGTLVITIAALIVIKLADLPVLVTVILVGALLVLLMYVMVSQMGTDKTKKDPPADGNRLSLGKHLLNMLSLSCLKDT